VKWLHDETPAQDVAFGDMIAYGRVSRASRLPGAKQQNVIFEAVLQNVDTTAVVFPSHNKPT
jgi:hypothetical protein